MVSDHSRVYRKYYLPPPHTNFLQSPEVRYSRKPGTTPQTFFSSTYKVVCSSVNGMLLRECQITTSNQSCHIFVLILHVFSGDSSEQDDHPSVRPYAPNHVQPYVLNSTLASTTESSQNTHALPSHPTDEDPLGPLPGNWEMAYTENGEVYFIE